MNSGKSTSERPSGGQYNIRSEKSPRVMRKRIEGGTVAPDGVRVRDTILDMPPVIVEEGAPIIKVRFDESQSGSVERKVVIESGADEQRDDDTDKMLIVSEREVGRRDNTLIGTVAPDPGFDKAISIFTREEGDGAIKGDEELLLSMKVFLEDCEFDFKRARDPGYNKARLDWEAFKANINIVRKMDITYESFFKGDKVERKAKIFIAATTKRLFIVSMIPPEIVQNAIRALVSKAKLTDTTIVQHPAKDKRGRPINKSDGSRLNSPVYITRIISPAMQAMLLSEMGLGQLAGCVTNESQESKVSHSIAPPVRGMVVDHDQFIERICECTAETSSIEYFDPKQEIADNLTLVYALTDEKDRRCYHLTIVFFNPFTGKKKDKKYLMYVDPVDSSDLMEKDPRIFLHKGEKCLLIEVENEEEPNPS